MASIITNRSALLALQSVAAANRELAAVQQRVSTGLKVGSARDKGAIYAIAQNLRADVAGWGAAEQSLQRVQSGLDVSSTAASAINDALVELRSKVTAYSDPSQSAASIALLRQDIEGLIRQVSQQASLADFDGLNFVNGGGSPGIVLRAPSTRYQLPTSPLTPQSFNTVMSSGAPNSSVSSAMRTAYNLSLPYSPMTPDEFAAFAVAPPRAVSPGTSVVPNGALVTGSQTSTVQRSIYGAHPWGEYPTRVSLEYDMMVDPDVVEVWQNGRRIAATGQPQAVNGTAVGAGVPVSGRQMISFDYIPAHGETVEIRINDGRTGTPLISYGTSTGPAGSVGPAPNATISQSISSTPQTTPLPATPLNLETSGSQAENGTRTVAVDGGANGGRVDLLFDASLTPDIVEIWQNGRRVAASGQAYVSGGATVGAGMPTPGVQLISFDYDPDDGHALEFRFNENNAYPGSAWAVGGLTLRPIGSALPSVGATPTTTREVIVGVTDDAEFEGATAPPLTPETYATSSASRIYTIDGGANPGRVDIAFDAYDDDDVLEVRQAGILIAATGSVTGPHQLSFNYNPADGRSLEFSFNPGDPTPGAWTVGAIAFNPIGSPPVTTQVFGGPLANQIGGTIFTKITPVTSSDGTVLEVATRDLTAGGLGLVGLDCTNPQSLLTAVDGAIRIATEAASHLGNQGRLISTLLTQNTRQRDTLENGIGNLVDADLAKEAAKLQAAQIKAKLASQTLSIANKEPQWILSLFRA